MLNYEEHGLIEPIWINPESGFRYYGAQSMARVRHIRALQKIGISLDEIGLYFKGDDNTLREHMKRLKELRQVIDAQIIRTEAFLTPTGEFTVRRTVLPEGHFVMTTKKCETIQDKFLMLWQFSAEVLGRGWQLADRENGLISISHTDPNVPNFGLTSALWALKEPNKESIYLPEREAIFVNVKGPYSQIPKAISVLREYARTHDLYADGDLCFCYLTSPQSHATPDSYVTQVYMQV